MFNMKIFGLIVLAIAGVNAATNSSTAASTAAAAAPTPDACIIGCSQKGAVAAGCVSVTNFTCTCTSPQFANLTGACLKANCTANDITTAGMLGKAECANFTTTSTPASTATTPATSSSAAALGNDMQIGMQGLVAAALAVVGAAVGGAMII